MNRECFFFRHAHLVLIVLGLTGINLLWWSAYFFTGLPTGTLYSSGTAFSTDATVLKFTGKMMIKQENVYYFVKVNWDGKSNTMQESGRISRGSHGTINVALKNSSSLGASLLNEKELEEDLLFSRSYMQSGNAKLSLLALPGAFEGFCFYVVDMHKIQCGAPRLNSTYK